MASSTSPASLREASFSTMKRSVSFARTPCFLTSKVAWHKEEATTQNVLLNTASLACCETRSGQPSSPPERGTQPATEAGLNRSCHGTPRTWVQGSLTVAPQLETAQRSVLSFQPDPLDPTAPWAPTSLWESNPSPEDTTLPQVKGKQLRKARPAIAAHCYGHLRPL